MRTRVLLVALALALAPACATPTSASAPASTSAPDEDVVEQYPDELLSQDLVVGTGETAVAGRSVTVHYTGWLTSGVKFDSSLGREPLTFRLGARQVIRGWDQGIAGMRVGGKRRLTIPPRLGYGERTKGPIPAHSHLLFEVELLAVSP